MSVRSPTPLARAPVPVRVQVRPLPARVGADLLVLGPGPGHPADARCLPLLTGPAVAPDLPVLGSCLGHQAIGLAFRAVS